MTAPRKIAQQQIWIGLKDLTVETAELANALTTVCNPFADFDPASLCSVDTSALTDTLKAALENNNFSEVCLAPPMLVTASEKLRKLGESLIGLLMQLQLRQEFLWQAPFSCL